MKKASKKAPVIKFRKKPHVAVIEARFYDDLNDLMVAGATAELKRHGATHEVITVPGAMEIPLALQLCAGRKKKKFDAYVVLGCVIRGGTTHYESVCEESIGGTTDVSLKLGLPVGNGILTTENKKQAEERANPKKLDKAGAAAYAALKMLKLKQDCA